MPIVSIFPTGSGGSGGGGGIPLAPVIGLFTKGGINFLHIRI